MKITVVTVTYNCEKEVEKTIQSVLSQSYPDIEYIIVDGASEDGTLDVVNKYKDKISKVVSEPDKGVYDAMNKGIQLATGEWVNFMNAGDSFYDTEVISRLFGSSQVGDVVFGNTMIKAKDRVFEIKYDPTFWKHKLMPSCHQSIFVRRNFLLSNPFDLKYKISADVDSIVRIKKSGATLRYVDTIVSIYDSTEGISQNPRLYYRELYDIAFPLPINYIMYFVFYIKMNIKKIIKLCIHNCEKIFSQDSNMEE